MTREKGTKGRGREQWWSPSVRWASPLFRSDGGSSEGSRVQLRR